MYTPNSLRTKSEIERTGRVWEELTDPQKEYFMKWGVREFDTPDWVKEIKIYRSEDRGC
jgi:hypothetical protein